MSVPESFGARFNAPINVLNALSTEIISAVRGLKQKMDVIEQHEIFRYYL